ncbi:MAG: hypothetical protein AAB686_00390 [Patescibacteria group bacterium]
MQQGTVTPGKQAIERICALRGTVGERILEEIAHPTSQPMRHQRHFGMWIHPWMVLGYETRRGVVVVNSATRVPLLLERGLGVREELRTLVIQEVPGCRLSLKPVSNSNGVLVLRVGSEMCDNRLKSFATQIVATFVVHGSGWQNRKGRVLPEPYGDRVDPVAKAKREAKKRVRRSRSAESYDRYMGLW